MQKVLVMVVAGFVALSFVSGAAAQEDVKAILEKAVKAHGGKENLAKMNAVNSKSKGKIEIYGGLNFFQEATTNLPKQFKEIISLDTNGKTYTNITVFDDGKAWASANGEPVNLDEKLLEEIKQARNLMELSSLRFVDNKDYTVTPLGDSKVSEKPVVGVKVTRQGYRDANLYFSKDTGLLSMMANQVYDPITMKDTTEERQILSYQDVNGLKVPKRIVVKRDGKPYVDAEVTEFKILDKVDPAVFAKP
jgi:hypothetical protein